MAFLGSSTGLILQCTYSLQGPDYRCAAQINFDGVASSRVVTEVSQNHLDGKNNSDVTQLLITETFVGFIPLNVSAFFPILDRFDMRNASITEITRDSLRGLFRLRTFYAFRNLIERIGVDVFIDNPELQVIYFDNNPVRHVAHRVFDHLTQLITLGFSFDNCIGGGAYNRAAVVLMMSRLLVNCPPTFEMIETQIINGELLQEQFIVARNETDQRITEEINAVRAETVEEINAVRTDTDQQITELSEEIRVLRQRLDLLEESGMK